MSPISDKDVDKHRHILMYDDETVMSAVIALRNQGGQDWWHLVVDLDNDTYAVARFSDLAALVEKEGAASLERTLGDLVDKALIKAEIMVDQDQGDLQSVWERTADSESHVAVVLKSGAFRGIIPVGGTRGPGGPFESNLLSLAGQYAQIPEKGTLSRRRKKAKKKGE